MSSAWAAIAPVETVAELDASWLTAALGRRIDTVDASPVGSGQIGSCYRLEVSGEDGVERLIAKLGAADPAARELLAGAYRTETRFYTDLAPGLAVRVPRCHLATEVVDGRVVLLLDEVPQSRQGDQIAGCTPEQAEAAARNLAGLHAPRWCDPGLLELGWITAADDESATMLGDLAGPTIEAFLAQVGPLLSTEVREILTGLTPWFAGWLLAHPERFAPVHGDYRLDNLMFATAGDGVVAVDWQTLSIGLPARDLAYLLGTGLTPPDRRAHERAIVEAYHDELVRLGVTDYAAATCWDDYRFAMLQGPLVAVFGCAYGTRSERGDRMFAAMVERSCIALRDLGTLDLVAAVVGAD